MNENEKSKSPSLTLSIFFGTFFTGILVYSVCAVIFVFNMYGYFERQVFSELALEAEFLEEFVLTKEFSKFANLKTQNRITLIHSDGTVYFDSFVESSSMEDHSHRQEFVEAVQKGVTTVSRYSSTMTEKTLYFARQLSNGDIIRLSCNQNSVWILLLQMAQILLVVLVIAMILSVLIAQYISKKVTEPFNRINLDCPDEISVYEELKPFTRRILEENYEKNQREQLRQQFSANVSHELKTPLTSISGFAEILKTGNVDESTTKEFAGTIYSECQRMIALVNDIIKLSKLDEKSITQEKEGISLRDIAREVITLLSPVAEKKKVSLRLSGDSGMMNGVPSVIYEMVYNLVDNAIKYNKENGYVIVEIKNMIDTGKIFFSVTDSGIGIPENERDRIFERFYRIDKSRSKELGGTGLGLSIVKHAAKYHNASILISSEVGKGSKFTVVFTNS